MAGRLCDAGAAATTGAGRQSHGGQCAVQDRAGTRNPDGVRRCLAADAGLTDQPGARQCPAARPLATTLQAGIQAGWEIDLFGGATQALRAAHSRLEAAQAGWHNARACWTPRHKRARPIIMATIAMGAGMLPIAVGFGTADPSFRSPMSIAVIGGLITSTVLSLLVVPVVFTYMDDLAHFIKRNAARLGRLGRKTEPR